MRMKLTRLAIVAVLFVVAIPASGQEEQQPGAVQTAPPDIPSKKTCFNVRDVRSISAVEDRFVYVRCIRDRHYLLTMVNGCIGLQNSISVAVANRYNRVCSLDRGVIVYKDFDLTRKCGVLLIEEVASRDAAIESIAKKKEAALKGEWQDS